MQAGGAVKAGGMGYGNYSRYRRGVIHVQKCHYTKKKEMFTPDEAAGNAKITNVGFEYHFSPLSSALDFDVTHSVRSYGPVIYFQHLLQSFQYHLCVCTLIFVKQPEVSCSFKLSLCNRLATSDDNDEDDADDGVRL